MSNTNTNSPAFPSHGSMGEVTHEGMTLRDYFAAKAMQNVFNTGCDDDERRYIAMHAYKMADAMLKAREA
jgi:hypothetical protein